MEQICNDLEAEYKELDALVFGLDEPRWRTVTPFHGWDIKDAITHIAFTDSNAGLAATDPDAFVRHRELFLKKTILEDKKAVRPDLGLKNTAELLDFWRRERNGMLKALGQKKPEERLKWYGPDMSARSCATARIMETWAHGQDIYDALKKVRPLTDRIRHVAHLGVMTFGWSFSNRNMEVPETPIRVELISPGGEMWTWGPESATETVRGSANDFCLVVTRRRHVADTGIVTTGHIAGKWMGIAQAFAGPPENGPLKQ